MGDKSPKSKQRGQKQKERGQKQKDRAKAGGAAEAKSKQDNQSQAPRMPAKGKK